LTQRCRCEIIAKELTVLRKYFPLLICAAVALIFAFSWFKLYNSDDPAHTGKLFRFGEDEAIDLISIENTRGNFAFFRENSRWVVEENGMRYRANETKMRLVTGALLSLDVKRTLKGERAEYGLSSPDATVAFTTNSGKRRAFVIGKTAPDFLSAYARETGSGRVALVETAVAGHMTGSLAAYRDREIFNVELTNLTGIARYAEGALVCEFGNARGKGWRVKYPFEAPARTIEMNEFIAGMRNWRIASFPDTNARGGDFGLDSPNISGGAIVLLDGAGGVQTIEIGNRDGIYAYVRYGQSGDIAALYAADVNIADLDPVRMMFVAPLRAALADVRSIKIAAAGGVYELIYDSAARSAEFMGSRISEADFINIFYRFTTMSASGFDDLSPNRGETSASLDIETADGGKRSLVLTARDNESYFMRINGDDTPFYMAERRLGDLMNRLAGLTDRIR
jgi:hypothetical protein